MYENTELIAVKIKKIMLDRGIKHKDITDSGIHKIIVYSVLKIGKASTKRDYKISSLMSVLKFLKIKLKDL